MRSEILSVVRSESSSHTMSGNNDVDALLVPQKWNQRACIGKRAVSMIALCQTRDVLRKTTGYLTSHLPDPTAHCHRT